MARGSHLKPMCARCNRADVEVFTPTLLRGAWILVPAASNARHPVCRECGLVVLASK